MFSEKYGTSIKYLLRQKFSLRAEISYNKTFSLSGVKTKNQYANLQYVPRGVIIMTKLSVYLPCCLRLLNFDFKCIPMVLPPRCL